jgi:hypothetical protein
MTTWTNSKMASVGDTGPRLEGDGPRAVHGNLSAWDVKGTQQQQPVTRIRKRLLKLSIDWMQTPEEPEERGGNKIYFSVHTTVTGTTGITVSRVLRLPCHVELDVIGGGGTRRLVEALFVLRNERGCTFAVFDAIDQVHFIVKPNEIVSILDSLPDRKALARKQINNLTDCFKPRARVRVGWKRKLSALGRVLKGMIAQQRAPDVVGTIV